jgi:arginyl-tRNA synthetase
MMPAPRSTSSPARPICVIARRWAKRSARFPRGSIPGVSQAGRGGLARIHGAKLVDRPESEWLATVRDTAVAMMSDEIRKDLAALNIHHDVFFSERTLHHGGIAAAVTAMRRRDLVYEGRLPPPKGQLPEDWEDREQTLFRTTAFGDDMDRPLVKSDGSYTYFAADVAYARDKIARGFEELVYVLGADHGGYVRRLEAVTAALSEGRVKLVVRLCQLVKLYRAGEPVRMSKRSGEFVTLREVVDEVGADVVRFIMLYRKNDAPLDFDFAKVTEQSRDNPVFYVQYAHARIASVFRNAEADLKGVDLGPAALAGPISRCLTIPANFRSSAALPAIRASWRPLPRRMNRIASPFFSTNWRAIFMLFGTKAKTRRI